MVEMLRENPEEQPFCWERLERGDSLGQICLLKGCNYMATFRVSSDSEAEVLVMNRETFLSMMYDSKLTNAVINYQMLQRLHKLQESTKK